MTGDLEACLDGMEIEIIAKPPAGAPADFRERLVLHLKTTDPARLQAAENDFRGVWDSEIQYIAEQVAKHLPPLLGWLAAAADPEKLREGYCGRALRVWSITLESGACMIFESVVESHKVAALDSLELPDEEKESPCPVCGSRDWTVTHWTEDLRLRGCDRCCPTPDASIPACASVHEQRDEAAEDQDTEE